MARRLQIDWRESEEELYERYKQEKDYQNRMRLHALWLLRQGRMMKEVAELVGVHSYSPHLNPSERDFEYLRSKVEGQVYGTIAAKK